MGLANSKQKITTVWLVRPNEKVSGLRKASTLLRALKGFEFSPATGWRGRQLGLRGLKRTHQLRGRGLAQRLRAQLLLQL